MVQQLTDGRGRSDNGLYILYRPHEGIEKTEFAGEGRLTAAIQRSRQRALKDERIFHTIR